jgi:hypothetical protein
MKIRPLTRLCAVLAAGLFASGPASAEVLDTLHEYGDAATGEATSNAGFARGFATPAATDTGGAPATNTYTLTAGGADFWGGSDQGSAIFDETGPARVGDFSAVVRMRIGEAGEPLASGGWGRTGIQARKTPAAANSANFSVYRRSDGAQPIVMGERSSDGAGTGEGGAPNFAVNLTPHQTTWVWLALHRLGNRVAMSWAPDNAGVPGTWSAFSSRVASADQLGPVYVGLAHQNHGTAGAGKTSTTTYTNFSVGPFNPALGAATPVLPAIGSLPGPKGECNSFGIFENRAPGGGNLGLTVTLLSQAPVNASTGQVSVLDVTDPDTNGSGGPVLQGTPIPYLTNTVGVDDNDIQTVAKGRLKVTMAGDYTFNFHGDDGFAARISRNGVGIPWSALEGAGTIDLGDPSTVYFPDGTGDHNTRTVINLSSGEYDLEYVNWEGAGGAYYEVTVHKGNVLGLPRANWLALGDPSVIAGEIIPPAAVTIGAPVNVYKVNGAAPGDPDGNDATAPSRFSNGIRTAVADGIANMTAATNTRTSTIIQEGETPNPGQADNYQLGVFGSLVVDDGDGTPGESIDLSFAIRTDDGSQLRIIGQDFLAVAGDGRTYLEDIAGDMALTGDFFTGNTNSIGHITLVEGTYQFESWMYEGGGGSRYELRWASGFQTDPNDLGRFQVIGLAMPIPIPENVGIGLVDGTTASVGLSFTSDRNLDAILNPADPAGLAIDQSTGLPHANWNSTIGIPSAAAATPRDGSNADIAAPNAGVLVANIDGTATPTGITVNWSANNTWNTNNGTTSGDNKLMNGYLDNNAANPNIPINLAGISSTFQDGYSVYVYIGSDGNGRTGTIENVGGVTYSYSTNSQLGGTFPGAYARTTDTGAGNPPANYAVFSGLSGDTQSFVFHRGSSNSGAHGIQIVGVPVPAGPLVVHDGPSDADPVLMSGGLVDFGDTELGDSVTRTFTLSNPGARALVIDGDITATGDFTVLNGSGVVVPGFGTYGLDVRFDANMDNQGTVSIRTNCGMPMEFTFDVLGGVLPVLNVKDVVVNEITGTGTSAPITYPVSASDESGPVTIDCTPPDGSTFPVGVNTVSCTATDGDGNETTKEFTVTVLGIIPTPGTPLPEIVSFTGDVPNDPDGVGVPAGTSVGTALHAFTNDNSDVLLETSLSGSSQSVLLSDASGTLAAVGVKGVDGVTGFNYLNISNDGASNFRDDTATDFRGTTVLGGVPTSIPAPKSDFVNVYQQAKAGSGAIAAAPVSFRLNVGGTTVFNDSAIFDGAGFVREGDPITAMPGATYGQIFPRVVAGSDSEVIAFSSNISGGGSVNRAVFVGPAGGPYAIAVQSGTVVPGTNGGILNESSAEAINNAGQLALVGGLRFSAIINTGNNSVLLSNRNGGLELIAREGAAVPCLNDPALTFKSFREVYLADNGTVTFFAFLGGNANSGNDGSLWSSELDGTIHLIAREGETANSVEGLTQQLLVVTASTSGKAAFLARLVPGFGDATTSNNIGLWAESDDVPAPQLVVRRGDMFDLTEGDTRNVGGIAIDYTNNAFGGSGGYGRVFNTEGKIVTRLQLDGNGGGVFLLDANGGAMMPQ